MLELNEILKKIYFSAVIYRASIMRQAFGGGRGNLQVIFSMGNT